MTTRTFKQLGQAYGTSPVTIVAKIDGEEVFNGTLHTLDQPLPEMPIVPIKLGWGSPLFAWTAGVGYVGTKPMEITVTGGKLLLSNTVANYIVTPPYGPAKLPGDPDYIPDAPPPNPNAVDKSMLYGPYVDNTVLHKDPLSNVTINGQAQDQADFNTGDLSGQWFWVLNDGDVFTADVIHIAGVE